MYVGLGLSFCFAVVSIAPRKSGLSSQQLAGAQVRYCSQCIPNVVLDKNAKFPVPFSSCSNYIRLLSGVLLNVGEM